MDVLVSIENIFIRFMLRFNGYEFCIRIDVFFGRDLHIFWFCLLFLVELAVSVIWSVDEE